MHARLLTFTGSDRVDEALGILSDTSLPLLKAQPGFCGLSAGVDRTAKSRQRPLALVLRVRHC